MPRNALSPDDDTEDDDALTAAKRARQPKPKPPAVNTEPQSQPPVDWSDVVRHLQRIPDPDALPPVSQMIDIGPADAYGWAKTYGWNDPNARLPQQAQNALLGQAWETSGLPSSANEYYSKTPAQVLLQQQRQPKTPLEQFIAASLRQQQLNPQLPSYAPTANYAAIGTDPRFLNLRPSDLIEDQRPTALRTDPMAYYSPFRGMR